MILKPVRQFIAGALTVPIVLIKNKKTAVAVSLFLNFMQTQQEFHQVDERES